MRTPTAVLTVVASAAALTAAWQVGSKPQTHPVSGVHVVAAPPAHAAPPSPKRTTGTSGTGGHKRKKATSSAPTTPTAPTRRKVDGAVVSTPYGNVQVQVVLLGRRIIDVNALHLTDANSTSRSISAGAAPTLRREALRAQSANIDAVSGASYTSEGYKQSLQAALDAARA